MSRRILRQVSRWTLRGLLCLGLVVAAVLAVFRWQADLRENQVAGEAAPRAGRFVKAHDVDLFVQEAGDSSRAAVVFVHGTGAWSETWQPAMKAVADAGFRAIALDLPPFGYSQRPDPKHYGKEDQGRRIVGLLEAQMRDDNFVSVYEGRGLMSI